MDPQCGDLVVLRQSSEDYYHPEPLMERGEGTPIVRAGTRCLCAGMAVDGRVILALRSGWALIEREHVESVECPGANRERKQIAGWIRRDGCEWVHVGNPAAEDATRLAMRWTADAIESGKYAAEKEG